MQKFAIYAIVAIIFAVFGFSFARYCPLASPKQASAAPTTDPAADIQAAKSTGALTNQLTTTRSQLALYKLQHNDNFPDFRKFGWKQLTFKSNAAGQITGNDRAGNPLYGPYFLSAPTNPLTKSSEVLVIASIPQNFKADGTYGFVFEESTGKFFALTADGKPFDESATATAR
jgi:hypothetical protein